MTENNSLAVVTGASSGFGVEFARCFAKQSTDVVLVARRVELLEKLSNELEEKFNIKAHVISADLSTVEGTQNCVAQIDALGAKVEYLINNAGLGANGDFVDMDENKISNMINVNMASLTYLTRHYSSRMKKNGFGRILNVASTAAFQPGPKMAVYFATKAYVLSFSQALNYELRKTGVTVTTLCPGPSESEFAITADMDESAMFKRKLPTSKEIAEYGFKAMMKSKDVAIPGLFNKVGAFASRLTPRKFSLVILDKMQVL